MLDQLSAQLDQYFVEDVVRRALDRPAFVLDAWQLQPITCTNVSAYSRGLYRVRGSGHDGATRLFWSVVLKLFIAPDSPTTDDPDQPFFWRREALLYQSGWLATLPVGLPDTILAGSGRCGARVAQPAIACLSVRRMDRSASTG